MMFWIVAAGMTAGVVALLAIPLLRPPRAIADRADFDLEVYRDQLAELERDVARGVVSPEQAVSAKAEIGRRMLAVANTRAGEGVAETAPTVNPKRSRVLAVLIAAIIPMGALTLYLPLGNPDLPARPFASRDLDRERNRPPESVLKAVAALREQLKQNPDDARGWGILGRALARMGEWKEAADALGHTLALTPDDMESTAARAEALIHAADGKVDAEARALLAKVRAADPEDPRARHYQAVAKQQDGDDKGALEEWRALMAITPADAPYLEVIKSNIEGTASKLGLDIAAVMPKPLPPSAPSSETARMPPQMPGGGQVPGDAEGRQKMILGMVAQLAEKLKANPEDVDGWLKLARSYKVLGDAAKSQEAARQAVAHGPKRADAFMALGDALMGDFATDGTHKLPDGAREALNQSLALDPSNRDVLWLLGNDAAASGDKAKAAELWGRLLAQLDPKDLDHDFLKRQIEGL